MGFSRIGSTGEEIFELKITDVTGKPLDTWKVNKRDFPEMIQMITEKYGFKVKIIVKKKQTDLDWAI